MASPIEIRALPAPPKVRSDGRIRIPPRAGNPTPEQEKRLRLAAELSQERKREEEDRRYYSDTSLNSLLNQAIAAQKAEANRPFIPTTAAYPLASQNQTSFASPAAAYMRERQLEREQEQVARGLLDETSPARVTNFALRTGNGAGDNNRERSFLERMAQSGLLSTLQGMARAERQYGVGPLAAFSESNLDVQAARSAAEQKAAETQAKVDIERLKNQPKPPKPSTEITNLYKEMGVYQSGLKTFDRIKGILSKSIATGGAGSALAGLNNIAAAFNINLPTDAQTSVNKAVAEIRTQLIASRAYGREANKDEQKLIRALIPEAGTFQTIKELE